MAILAVFALSPSVALGPLPDQFAGLEVVGGEQRVGRGRRIERRVEGDDEDARVARLLHGRDDRGRVARHEQDALGAGRDQLLDRAHLAVVVAVELAGVGLRRQPEFLGLGLEAFLHLDEERIGVGLGDEADDRPVGVGWRACQGEGERRRGDGREDAGNVLTLVPPKGIQSATLFPGSDREAAVASRRPPCVVGRNFAPNSGLVSRIIISVVIILDRRSVRLNLGLQPTEIRGQEDDGGGRKPARAIPPLGRAGAFAFRRRSRRSRAAQTSPASASTTSGCCFRWCGASDPCPRSRWRG